MNKKKTLAAVALALLTIIGAASPVRADRPTSGDHLHPTRVTRPPIGWTQFCARDPGECVNRNGDVRRVALDTARMSALVEVNALVNSMVASVSDLENYGVLEFWTYPIDNRGDCEDYVLLKRRLLMARGWPPEALLITVVLDREGAGHAVLTVMTDQGELILDNLSDRALNWSDTGLTFIKRQSSANPNLWVDLGGILGTPLTATARPPVAR